LDAGGEESVDEAEGVEGGEGGDGGPGVEENAG